jgi:hypothetical protein
MARRPAPQPEPPVLTVQQKRRRVERLQNCIRDLEAFDPQKVQKRYGVPEVMALEAAIDEALSAAFGHGSPAYDRYKRAASLDSGPHIARMGSAFGRGPQIDYDARDAQEARRYLAEGKEQSIALLQQAIRTLEDEIADQEHDASPAPLTHAAAPVPEPALADEPVPDAALTAIREALEDIKSQLPAMTVSNTVKSEIHADIAQIEAETERPTPRRRFVKVFLESLRDNLAKAAAVGLVAIIGTILAKFFGVL